MSSCWSVCKRIVALAVLLSCITTVLAWPGMKGAKGANHPPKAIDVEITATIDGTEEGPLVGPVCTVDAHGTWPEMGPCPNMPQPLPPGPAPVHNHYEWPNDFYLDWKMIFVPDKTDTPPYYPLPRTAYNITRGKTWYHTVDADAGLRNMRESYYDFCIPVFGDPTSPMGSRNDYSCDFINVGATNISYVVMHDDRPPGVPECCIIGKPFHAPPPNFSDKMPVRWSASSPGGYVDWTAVWDQDAGPFAYGWDANTRLPHAFYMMGVPWIASWMWQPFSNFTAAVPDPKVWVFPDVCLTADRCPGW